MSYTQQQVARFFANAIAPKKPVKRKTQAERRAEIRDAQIAALEEAIATIRHKARRELSPKWQHGYNSAVSAIELQIAVLRGELTKAQAEAA